MRKTKIEIKGTKFYLGGAPTYPGVFWQGSEIEGMLLNTRMVQGIFDDKNPKTAHYWVYPDTGVWDPDRNTTEFIEAMPIWKEHGVLAFTIGLQGGCPKGDCALGQPWHNSAVNPDGTLDMAYMDRLERILDRADELNMVAILSYFYFGQDKRMLGEESVINATVAATNWVIDRGYTNVLIETVNETDNIYELPILRPKRAHELVALVQKVSRERGFPLYSSVSYVSKVPSDEVIGVSDYVLIHGNCGGPDWVEELIRKVRESPSYRGQPIVNNEDPKFDLDQEDNNFSRSVMNGCSWGYLDIGINNYNDGYQRVPVQWGINTKEKRDFFALARRISGGVN